MSFTPFDIKYVPPPTVEELPVSASVGASSGASAIGANSTAMSLASQIQDLLDTNSFIQSLILNNTANIAINIDAASDPATIQSLSRIYGQNVTTITSQMYNQMLVAKMNVAQIQISSAGTDILANPFEQGDLFQCTGAVTKALADAGDFNSLQLAYMEALKGDAVVLSNVQTALTTYPAATGTGTQADVSTTVTTTMTNMISGYQSVYASGFTLATADAISTDAADVVTNFLNTTGTELVQLATLFAMAKSMTLKNLSKNLLTGLAGFVLVLLLAQAGPHLMNIDRVMTQALGPIAKTISGLDVILNNVKRILYAVKLFASRVKQASIIVQTGSASGMSRNSTIVGGLPHNNQAYTPQSASGMSKGLQQTCEAIDWAQTTMNSNFALVNNSFTAASLRRLSFHSEFLNVMAMMQAVVSVENSIQAAKTNQSASPGQTPGTTQTSPSLLSTPTVVPVSNTTNTVNTTLIQNMPVNVQTTLIAGGAKLQIVEVDQLAS